VRRSGALRAAALRSAGVPGAAAIYAFATPSGPNRPAILGLSAFLLLVAVGLWRTAEQLTRSRLRVPLSLAAVGVHVGGIATLSYLDGGVSAPLGTVVWFSLPFFAVTVPLRLFAGLSAVTVTAYGAVALVGSPAPPGYPLVYTFGFLGVSALCAGHAQILASTRRQLIEASQKDPLTGCLNRRGFDRRLDGELSRAQRTGRPVTLVLVDLDAFKAVNDTYGHQVGDELLVWVGRTIQQTARANDAVGRLGGDEFGLILTDTNPIDAAAVVARIEAALAQRCPASLGYASFPSQGADAQQLSRLADLRLYATKRTRPERAPDPSAGRGAAAVGPAPTAPSAEARHRDMAVATASMSLMNFAIGLVHVAFLAGASDRRATLLGVLGVGALQALAVLLGAATVARWRLTSPVLAVHVVGSYALAFLATGVDGGLHSPLAVGLLTPLPLIALGLAPRLALPLLTATSAGYVLLGAVVGSPGWWYAAIHLVGMLSISVGCALQGRQAAEQRRQLSRLSRVDGLTDVLNRRGLEERFADELAHAHRHGGPLSLLLLDLDGFKALNDTQGHAAGDELLCWVADRLTELLRAHDVVARVGGDEFVAVLGDCPAAEAARIAERVTSCLDERTSVCIGTATTGLDGTDFDSLYGHADHDLYAEKARRRHPPRGLLPGR
jgi:diguanylate cyclase (GGDEF)-like protein